VQRSLLGCTVAFMDRAVIQPVCHSDPERSALSDTQISLLVGFAFAAFNALFGLPVARWIDGGRRRTIAAMGIAVWSVAHRVAAWRQFLATVPW